MALPALVRPDGEVWLGLQVQHNFGDASRDLAAALERALHAEPGAQVAMVSDPGPGPRLQDLVDPDATFHVEVHDGYDFWLAGLDDPTGQIAASLESANRAASPTRRIGSVEAAYWTQLGERQFVRWVLPHQEDRLLDALARLHAAGEDGLGPGRLIGSFRAHGLLVPVWELPAGTGAGALAEPAALLERQLEQALSDRSPLSAAERAARNGLATRQLTLR